MVLVLAAEVVEVVRAAPTQEAGVTWGQLVLVILALAGAVTFLFRTLMAKSDAHLAQCTQDRRDAIEIVKQKDEKIEKLHTDVRDIVTQALNNSAAADAKLADAVVQLKDGLSENTKTLRDIRCLNQSGMHQAVKT